MGIIAEASVNQIEQLLRCDIIYFEQLFTNKRILRVRDTYEVPDHLRDIVNFVAGLQGFPFASWTPTPTIATLGGNTPSTLYTLYDVDVPTSSCNCDSSQAVVEFSGANYSPTDLQTFFSDYAPTLTGQVVEEVFGNNNPSGHISIEANLDVQYIMAMGGFISTYDYVQPINPNILDAFLDYTWVVGNQTNPPLVHSISWGEYGGQYDNNTVQQVNSEFMKMSSRGISVLLASGDNGVGCGDLCQSQEFDFPSSPYITMVGATGVSASGGERGAQFSSGGFSRDYYQPTWQASAVTSYLNSGVKLPDISYDKNGRAYPDVSALGVGLEVVVRGKSEPVDGTSCSAPIFGSIISLINAQRSLQ